MRKQLLQYFNWTRFGLIYQHGSKYTLVSLNLKMSEIILKNEYEKKKSALELTLFYYILNNNQYH